VNNRHLLLAAAISASLLVLSGCSQKDAPTAPAAVSQAPAESADDFIARVNAEYKAMYPEMTSAQWLASTYINADSERIAAKSNERWMTVLNGWIEQAGKYDGQPMSADTARAIALLKLMTAMPAPRDPAKVAELAGIAAKLEGDYGAGTYCTGEGDKQDCRQLGALENVLARSRDYNAQLDAWSGWHSTAIASRGRYQRFVELVNEGARQMGYNDAGAMWRSGYDMPAEQVVSETDRLWEQVKPLYEQLHCYTRNKLVAEYGADKGQLEGGLIPAHLTGNMWQQDWSNLWDILQPYAGAGSLDITAALEKQHQQNLRSSLGRLTGNASVEQRAEAIRAAELKTAQDMTRQAEQFYTGLGMPALPESYWNNTQFIKPLDRNVVCHASAWDMNMGGENGTNPDVRTKMCITPTEENFTTIYHELGHIYYDLAYNPQPPLFQGGANDGFHEAIGDTIVLAMTPRYLNSIGLVDAQAESHDATINAQMRMALSGVSFLPFGLLIDRWRWGVFDGSITPDNYNKAWWELKARYQGVAPAIPRGEEYFDAGAKYHVPGNTPYLRYFLARIYQYQFYKGLCDTAGHTGPLHECSFYGNAEAGQKFWAMLTKGASQPWQATLKEVTGSEQLDAAPMLAYFAPLQQWLAEQNAGQTCGWQAPGSSTAAAAPAQP